MADEMTAGFFGPFLKYQSGFPLHFDDREIQIDYTNTNTYRQRSRLSDQVKYFIYD